MATQNTNTDETQRLHVDASVPAATFEMLQQAAEMKGLSLSDYVVASASVAAEEVVSGREIMHLTVEDQERFANLLLDPPPVSDALKRAIQRNCDLVQPT